jgi:predicted alpha-1,2-mannosidase
MGKLHEITIALLVFVFFASCNTQNKSESDLDLSNNLTKYVDPFLGSDKDGRAFPGAARPFGMVKLGPDCGDRNAHAGYLQNEIMHGFSHTHTAGGGGGPKYGNILVMATSGSPDPNHRTSYTSNEKASPGFFAASLDTFDIDVELTASHSVGFHRYTFNTSGIGNIFFDAGSMLGKTFRIWPPERQHLVENYTEIVSDKSIKGYSTVKGGWNLGAPYTVYFYAETDREADEIRLWKDSTVLEYLQIVQDSVLPVGAFMSWGVQKGESINLKVGISFISTEKAKQNLLEIPHYDFDLAHADAEQEWNKLLNAVLIETENEDYKKMFYSGLYRTMLMPTDRSGENPEWHSDEPYYDDFLCLWDTYRTQKPLITLLKPQRKSAILNSLLDIYKQEGYIPDGRTGNYSGRTQGGSNSDILIADAFSKGLKGIDYELALRSMIQNAEVEPANTQKHGRGGIADYNTLGYISDKYERAGTRTMEYTYNDYCIAQVAKGLGKDDLYSKYLLRSENWKNLWNPMIESDGFKGFIWPRNSDGEWIHNEFTVHSSGAWDVFIYESHSWEMSFHVPHDVPGLIQFCGGPDIFIQRLDTFFTKKGNTGARWLNDYFNMKNQPGFLVPTYYIYAGKPYRTTQTVRRLIKEGFDTSREGLPGNGDSGAMGSWLAFHMMGFFPVAGKDLYLITAPHLDHVTINLSDGKTFRIVAHNVSEENIFISSAKLNGKHWDKAWLKHEHITAGGILEFSMTDQPTAWGAIMPPN